jgi:uncharacterized protein (TIGR02145 family)
MAENLNVGTKINSTAGGFLQMDNDTIEKYCYDNDSTNCELYGGLYEWPEAMQYGTTEGAQGICPDGWHIPAIGEWTILTDFLGGNVVAGGKMKSTGTLEDETGLWHAPNLGATNESGFTGLPGGYRRFDNGNFRFLGNFGYIWSSSLEFSDYALYIALFYNDFDVGQSSNNNFGLTIRCIRD